MFPHANVCFFFSLLLPASSQVAVLCLRGAPREATRRRPARRMMSRLEARTNQRQDEPLASTPTLFGDRYQTVDTLFQNSHDCKSHDIRELSFRGSSS